MRQKWIGWKISALIRGPRKTYGECRTVLLEAARAKNRKFSRGCVVLWCVARNLRNSDRRVTPREGSVGRSHEQTLIKGWGGETFDRITAWLYFCNKKSLKMATGYRRGNIKCQKGVRSCPPSLISETVLVPFRSVSVSRILIREECEICRMRKMRIMQQGKSFVSARVCTFYFCSLFFFVFVTLALK